MDRQREEIQYERIIKAQQGDTAAKNALINEHMRLVYSIARRFYDRGYEKDDLHQIGAIGLLKAIDKFNTDYQVCFSTYAVPLILGEIKRFLRDDGPLKVSRSTKRIALEAARLTDEIQKREGRMPGVLEIAAKLNCTPYEIERAREATMPPESFSAIVADGNKTIGDYLPDKQNENDLLDRLDLKAAVSDLTPREQSIIMMRYFEDKTQAEIAEKLGISQVQVSRLEKKILANFRNRLSCRQ